MHTNATLTRISSSPISFFIMDCIPATVAVIASTISVGAFMLIKRAASLLTAASDDISTSSGPPVTMATVGAEMKETKKKPRSLVTRIADLKPGDHVAFARKPISSQVHHGIVVSIHPDEDVFNVIEVLGTTNEVNGKPMSFFANRPHTFSTDAKREVYVVEYDEGECLPTSQVIRNAFCLAGIREAVEYNLLTRNCEHYANAIKTGIGLSVQANP